LFFLYIMDGYFFKSSHLALNKAMFFFLVPCWSFDSEEGLEDHGMIARFVTSY